MQKNIKYHDQRHETSKLCTRYNNQSHVLNNIKVTYTMNIIYIGLEEVNSFNIGESIHL